MRFDIARTTDWFDAPCPHPGAKSKTCKHGRRWEIEIGSLVELMTFVDEVKHPVIITTARFCDDSPRYRIEIYDGYRE